MSDPASPDEENSVEKLNQLPRPPLKNSASSSSASSSSRASSNLPSRQSSGSDIRQNDRNCTVSVTKDDRPSFRSRSARPSLAGNEYSTVSSGFGSCRRHSASHGNLPTNSEATIFRRETLESPRNSSSNEILRRLSAIEHSLQLQNENVQKHFAQLQTVLESISHKFSECCDAMNTRLSSLENLSDIIHSGVSSRQSHNVSPNPTVSITHSPTPSNSPQLDQKSASRKTSELALHSARTARPDTKSTTNDEFEVHCICQSDSPVVPLIHNDLVHFILRGQDTVSITSSRDNRHLFAVVLKSYNLFDSQKTDIRKAFSNCIRQFCPTILMYSGEVTLLGGDVDVDTRKFKLALYHTHITNKEEYSWEPIICSNWKVSAMSVELKGTVCASYENNGVAVVHVTPSLSIRSPSQMDIYLFSPMKIAGKYWKNAHTKLPDLDHGDRYKIQSCVAISNYIYCSLLVQEKPLCYIYKINLAPLKQCGKEALDSFEIDKISRNLKCCFLSALNEKLISITFEDMDSGKTLLEVKQYDDSACVTLAPVFQYYFQSQVKVVTASIVSGICNTVVVVYHDSKLQKCYVKRINMIY